MAIDAVHKGRATRQWAMTLWACECALGFGTTEQNGEGWACALEAGQRRGRKGRCNRLTTLDSKMVVLETVLVQEKCKYSSGMTCYVQKVLAWRIVGCDERQAYFRRSIA